MPLAVSQLLVFLPRSLAPSPARYQFAQLKTKPASPALTFVYHRHHSPHRYPTHQRRTCRLGFDRLLIRLCVVKWGTMREIEMKEVARWESQDLLEILHHSQTPDNNC